MPILALVLSLHVVAYIAFRIYWARLRRRAIQTTTVLSELEKLGLPPLPLDERISGAAIIAGGSFGGFLAARILVDYFEKVIIIEPDLRLNLHGSRISQRPQLHFFPSIALETFRRLFPSFDQEARKEGATIRNLWIRWTIGGFRPSHRPDQSPEQMNISRLTLESLLRRLIVSYAGDKLEIIQGTVTGVHPSSDGSRIDSVFYRSTNEGHVAIKHNVSSSFFVDCSGASSISPKILPAAGAGWGPYPRHQYGPNVSYHSAIVYIPESAREALARSVPHGDLDYGRWDQITFVETFQPTYESDKEFYGIQKVDGNRLILFHSGWGVDSLANSYTQFVEAVQNIQDRTLRTNPERKKQSEWTFDFLRILENSVDGIDNIKFEAYKMATSRWVAFEAASLPNNFAPIGDTRMRLNPAFGQGVTKILAEITVLNASLRALLPKSASVSPNISRDFLRRAKAVTEGLYDMNRLLDYGYNTTIPQDGETLDLGEDFRRYWVGLLRVCEHDPNVAAVVMQAFSGLAPGTDMTHPFIRLKVFLYQWWSAQK